MRALKERLLAFLFPAETDGWLALLRIGLGLQLVCYALSLGIDWNYLFAGTGQGLISRDLAEALLSLQSSFVPRLGWFVRLAAHFGVGEGKILFATWIVLLVAGCGLIAGFFSRSSAAVAWLVHLCAAMSGGFVTYGADNFMTIGLFYLMLSPLPDRYTLDRQWRKRPAAHPIDPQWLGFWRRVLQLHLCLIYFFGGLTKALGTGWWNGDNIWRALIRPPFNLIPPEALVTWKYLFPLLGISAWLIEICYPLFIWNNRTRKMWLICTIAMHIGIGAAMGMYLFSLVMIVLNVAAFGPGIAFARNIQPMPAAGCPSADSTAAELI
ncbi:MAG: HTTM domain-containing protein [Verrucomicrobiota bacterium]